MEFDDMGQFLHKGMDNQLFDGLFLTTYSSFDSFLRYG